MRIARVPVFLELPVYSNLPFQELRRPAKLPIRLTYGHGSPLNCGKSRYPNVNDLQRAARSIVIWVAISHHPVLRPPLPNASRNA
jgi:hypothetical protein